MIALDAQNGASGAPNDAELARLIDAWPTLPAAVKRGITAMVEAAASE